MRILMISAAFILGLTSTVQAATLNVNNVAGGLSSDYATPTEIAFGFDDVAGTLSSGTYNIFNFANLASGAQTVSLTFQLPAALTSYQNAGGYVRMKETPFQYSAEEGTRTDFDLVFNPGNLATAVVSQTLSFNLDNSYTGSPLFFAVNVTHGSSGAVSFGVNAPGNAIAPSPVPIPAAGLMLLAALAGFAALRGRKGGLVAA